MLSVVCEQPSLSSDVKNNIKINASINTSITTTNNNATSTANATTIDTSQTAPSSPSLQEKFAQIISAFQHPGEKRSKRHLLGAGGPPSSPRSNPSFQSEYPRSLHHGRNVSSSSITEHFMSPCTPLSTPPLRAREFGRRPHQQPSSSPQYPSLSHQQQPQQLQQLQDSCQQQQQSLEQRSASVCSSPQSVDSSSPVTLTRPLTVRFCSAMARQTSLLSAATEPKSNITDSHSTDQSSGENNPSNNNNKSYNNSSVSEDRDACVSNARRSSISSSVRHMPSPRTHAAEKSSLHSYGMWYEEPHVKVTWISNASFSPSPGSPRASSLPNSSSNITLRTLRTATEITHTFTSQRARSVEARFLDYKKKVDLQDIINDKRKFPLSLKEFRKYLCRNYCEENLDFLVEVRQFRSKCEQLAALDTQSPPDKVSTSMLSTARAICDTYITSGSPYEININHAMRKDILSSLSRFSAAASSTANQCSSPKDGDLTCVTVSASQSVVTSLHHPHPVSEVRDTDEVTQAQEKQQNSNTKIAERLAELRKSKILCSGSQLSTREAPFSFPSEIHPMASFRSLTASAAAVMNDATDPSSKKIEEVCNSNDSDEFPISRADKPRDSVTTTVQELTPESINSPRNLCDTSSSSPVLKSEQLRTFAHIFAGADREIVRLLQSGLHLERFLAECTGNISPEEASVRYYRGSLFLMSCFLFAFVLWMASCPPWISFLRLLMVAPLYFALTLLGSARSRVDLKLASVGGRSSCNTHFRPVFWMLQVLPIRNYEAIQDEELLADARHAAYRIQCVSLAIALALTVGFFFLPPLPCGS